MNGLQVFSYEGNEVRTVQKGSEIFWVLKDVCGILGIEKYRDAAARLDDDEREPVLVDTLGGRQEMIAVTESGLYSIILLSRKPEAKNSNAGSPMKCFPPSASTARMSLPLN